MVDACFGDREKLNLEDFQAISVNKSSDMLLTILNLLKIKLPCSENFFHYQADFEK